MKQIWIILNRGTSKQARHWDTSLTPQFENPTQCIKYIENRLGDSPIFIPYRIK
ncbi:MAG: hypothetical protein ACOCVF_02820 [bacterium]